MEHKLANSLDVYNNIKDISLEETAKVKNASSFSTPGSEQNVGRNLEMFRFIGYSKVDENGKILANTCNIESVQTKEAYENVPVLSLGLGHLKGIYTTFKSGDLVIVGWLDKNAPVIIGGINDNFSNKPDIVPALEGEEMLMTPKEAGSYIMVKKDDTIKIKNKTGAEILIEDGQVTITLDYGSSGTKIWMNDTEIRLSHSSSSGISLGNDVYMSANDDFNIISTDRTSLTCGSLWVNGDEGVTDNIEVDINAGTSTATLMFKNGLFIGATS